MNIDIGPLLFVLAVLSTIAGTGLYAGRGKPGAMSADAASHRSRAEAVRELFAVAKKASPPSPTDIAGTITGRIATAS